jgi:hypothetical protein
MTTRGFLLLLCAVAIGCGSSDADTQVSGAISCIMTEVVGTGTTARTAVACQEATGLPASQEYYFHLGCDNLYAADAGVPVNFTAVFASQGCSRANVAGGCQLTRSGMLTTTWWYYTDASVTTDAVRQACLGQGGTFVMP